MKRFTGKVSFITKKDGTVHARGSYLDHRGTRKQKWASVTTTRAAAKEEVIRKIEDALNGQEKAVTNFQELIEYYRNKYAIPPVYVDDEKVKGKESWQRVRSVLGFLDDFFGKKPLDRITRGAVEDYRVHMFEKPVKRVRDGKTVLEQRSLASVNEHLRVLRTVLSVAETEKWIDRAPSFKGLISAAAERKREVIPTEAEFIRILQATDTRQRLNHVKPIALMIADAGARPKEVWRLEWSDLDLDNRLVTLTSYKGKRVLRRTIPLSDRLHAELAKVPRLNDLVFGGIKDIKTAWKSIQMLAGVTFTPYALRHFFATRLDMLPLSDNQRQKLMGHTNQATFGRYAKLTEATLDNVRTMLNNMPVIDSSGSVN